MTSFRAFRIRQDDTGYRAGIETMDTGDLSQGELLVRVEWSSVNYKDALAGTGKGKILRSFPLNGGIDVAGTVVASTDPAFREGDKVLATGSGLSATVSTRGCLPHGPSPCPRRSRRARR
jgi:acrylyl-CoA reductase (NADPH)